MKRRRPPGSRNGAYFLVTRRPTRKVRPPAMHTLTAQFPNFLQGVTKIAHLVAHGHRGSHRSRLAGHVGTSNTFLVAPMAQRGNGKHRQSAA